MILKQEHTILIQLVVKTTLIELQHTQNLKILFFRYFRPNLLDIGFQLID